MPVPITLSSSVRQIKGVGDVKAKAFEKLGIFKASDLLFHYPRSYEERGKIIKISDAFDGELCSLMLTVNSVSPVKYIRGGLTLFEVKASDESGNIKLKFFNVPYAARSFASGKKFRVFGRIKSTPYGREMATPKYEPWTDDLPYYVPVYKTASPLTPKAVASAIAEILPLCADIKDILPESIRDEYSLIKKSDAVYTLHRPENPDDLQKARRALAFEDILVFRTALSSMRSENSLEKANPFSLKNTSVRSFFESLPFELTGAQQRSVKEIYSDLSSSRPMARLLQGDVGSGKTAVAAAALYLCVKNGFQACMMAPTELLASQHKKTLDKFLSPFGIKTALLVSSSKASEKRVVREALKNGEIDIAVGTHALITEQTSFKNLALAVVDEQHRFGVRQRAELLKKSEKDGVRAHMLVMSATPIPRSLSLIIFGDLDVSVIDELPKGRQKIETRIVSESEMQKVCTFVRAEIENGGRAYIVCPLVEESDTDERKSAESYYNDLVKGEFKNIKTGLIHGKMRASEKESVMSAFASGEIKILVATTVIEVGVDVPEATVMVIQNAESFGLSQLHQLRGRIGRGDKKSYCILVKSKDGGEDRLKVMRDTDDGFKVAEADLRQRGPGDFFGERQSGEFSLPVSAAGNIELLSETDALLKRIIADKNNKEYAPILKAASEFLLKSEASKTVN